jgi:hypothetical protein
VDTNLLIVFNRKTGRIRSQTNWNNAQNALRARVALERWHTNPDYEIVVLSGDSEESIRKTHSRYWMREG